MNADTLSFWKRTASAAEAAMQGDDMRDVAAVFAATFMVDTLENGRPIPPPTPEFNAKLAHAEVLAGRV